MLRVTPFSALMGAYPIGNHTVRFPLVSYEWQQLFERHPEVQEIFDSIQTPEGNYLLSRADIFNEPDTRRRIIKALIWGYPKGFQGKQNLSRIFDHIDNVTQILEPRLPRYTKNQMCDLFRELTAIPGLGFSTVTKLLYFFNVRVGNYKAVIVDSNVLKAIPNIREIRLCPTDYSPESYYQQVGYINRISERLGLDSPDKLEYFLFNFGKSINKK